LSSPFVAVRGLKPLDGICTATPSCCAVSVVADEVLADNVLADAVLPYVVSHNSVVIPIAVINKIFFIIYHSSYKNNKQAPEVFLVNGKSQPLANNSVYQ
jgi:hypothetical protein